MIREIVEGIGGIEIFGIVSLLLFVTTFTIAAVWALRMTKSHRYQMKQLPLEDATVPRGQGEH